MNERLAHRQLSQRERIASPYASPHQPIYGASDPGRAPQFRALSARYKQMAMREHDAVDRRALEHASTECIAMAEELEALAPVIDRSAEYGHAKTVAGRRRVLHELSGNDAYLITE